MKAGCLLMVSRIIMRVYQRVEHRNYDCHCMASGQIMATGVLGIMETQVVAPVFVQDLCNQTYQALFNDCVESSPNTAFHGPLNSFIVDNYSSHRRHLRRFWFYNCHFFERAW